MEPLEFASIEPAAVPALLDPAPDVADIGGAAVSAATTPSAPKRATHALGRAVATALLAVGLLAVGGVAAVSAASPTPSAPAASGSTTTPPSGATGAGGPGGAGGAGGAGAANCPGM
jgi:hypothetical protein